MLIRKRTTSQPLYKGVFFIQRFSVVMVTMHLIMVNFNGYKSENIHFDAMQLCNTTWYQYNSKLVR